MESTVSDPISQANVDSTWISFEPVTDGYTGLDQYMKILHSK